MARLCYNLISCNPSEYPHIFRITSAMLEDYVWKIVSVNGNLARRYQVVPSISTPAILPDSVAHLCSSGITSRTYTIDLIEFNGVNLLPSPQTLNVNGFVYLDFANNDLSPIVVSNCNAANTIENVPFWLNSIFSQYGVPASVIAKSMHPDCGMVITTSQNSYLKFRINIPAPQSGSGSYLYEVYPDGSVTVLHNGHMAIGYGGKPLDVCMTDPFRPPNITSVEERFNCVDYPSVYVAKSCSTSKEFYIEYEVEELLDENLVYKFSELSGCFTVSRVDRVDGVGYIPVSGFETFANCDECECEPMPPVPPVPPPPFDMKRRAVSPNYSFHFATADEIIDSYCPISDYAYDLMNEMKYGIDICCKVNFMEAWVDKEIMDLRKIKDEEACKVNRCCEPDCVIAEIISDCVAPFSPAVIII